MLTKGKITLFMTLCLLSLVSIGFASWTITEGPKEEQVLGSMMTDNFINSSEFVYLNTSKGDEILNEKNEVIGHKGYSVFDYYEYGYLDENKVATSSGYITVYFRFNVKQCYELLNSYSNSVKVIVKLGYAKGVTTNLNLFEDSPSLSTGKHTISANIFDVSSGVDVYFSNISNLYENKKQFTCELKFENLLTNYKNNLITDIDSDGNIEFSVKYHLTATTGDYFYYNIYTPLYMDNIEKNSFEVSVMVSSYNE